MDIRRMVEKRCEAAGIAPADILSVTSREEGGRVLAVVSYSWGRSHEMDLGPVEVEEVGATVTESKRVKVVEAELIPATKPKATPKRKARPKKKRG